MSENELNPTIETLISQEGLPSSYGHTVEQTILPLAHRILELRQRLGRPVLIGIHGAQGTGKSTLTLFLKEILSRHHGTATASFSIDDIYLTRAERQRLAGLVHPLFITRGVPGTHDVSLGQKVIDQLLAARPGDKTAIPAFDKARDDRAPRDQWPVFEGPADVILVEGWCLGAAPEPEEALARPVNTLEAEEDSHATWRSYVNECLKDSYRALFDRLDYLVMLKAPSMECVLEWRTLQEHKLAARHADAPKEGGGDEGAPSLRIMSDEEVARFIMHYQRVTEHCLREMPDRADVLIPVDADHSLEAPQFREPPASS
ncbi:kinase [Marinobacter szutsaonensis]